MVAGGKGYCGCLWVIECVRCERVAAVRMNDRVTYMHVWSGKRGRVRVCVFESGYVWVCVKTCARVQSLR